MTRSKEHTRRLLIAAGIDALRDLTAADLITAVGTRELARRAGVSPGTLFHHFGSVEAFAAELVARIYDPDTSPVGDINDKVHTVHAADRPAQAGPSLHRSEFARLLGDREHRLRVGLWAFGGEQARDAYGDYVRVSDGRIARQAEQLFASWGREIRTPFDITFVVAAQAALLSGSVIRHTTDPAAADADRFALAASALTLVMLRAPGDRRDIDDRLAEINYFAAQAAPAVPPEGRSATRARVLAAADELFALDGVDEVTIAMVARAAFVSPSTVYGLFEGKAALAVAVLLDQAGRALPSVALPEPADRRARLLAVAQLLAARPNCASAYVTALATGGRTPQADPLLSAVEAVIESAHPVGTVRDAAQGRQLARSAMLVLGARVLGRDQEPLDEVVQHVEDVFLAVLSRNG